MINENKEIENIYNDVYNLLLKKLVIIIFDISNILNQLGLTYEGLCHEIAMHFVYKKYITGKYDPEKSDISTYLLGDGNMAKHYIFDHIKISGKKAISNYINIDDEITEYDIDISDDFSEDVLKLLINDNILTTKEQKLFHELFIYNEKTREQINKLKKTKKFNILIIKIKDYAERQKNR